MYRGGVVLGNALQMNANDMLLFLQRFLQILFGGSEPFEFHRISDDVIYEKVRSALYNRAQGLL